MAAWLERTTSTSRRDEPSGRSLMMELDLPPAPGRTLTKRGTLTDVTSLALHGENRLRIDDIAFMQRFSTLFSRGLPAKRLNTITFNFGDRVAAWLSGFGKELRLVKEMQLEIPIDDTQAEVSLSRQSLPSGSHQSPAMSKVRRRSLVLMGAEDAAIRRREGRINHAGEFADLRSPKLVERMAATLLQAFVDSTRRHRHSIEEHGRATPKELQDAVEALSQAHPIGCIDRLYLWLTDTFTPDEKAELLGRRPRAPPPGPPPDAEQAVVMESAEATADSEDIVAGSRRASGAASPTRSTPREPARMSVSDIAAGHWPPAPSSSRRLSVSDTAGAGLPPGPPSSSRASLPSPQRRRAPVVSHRI